MATSALEQWAEDSGVPEQFHFKLLLVLEEIFSNIVRYAFPEGVMSLVRISFEHQPGSVILEFTDDGMPFNPLEASPADVASPLEERKVGGLGIHLVIQMADEVTYHRQNNWNILRVRIDYAAREEQSLGAKTGLNRRNH